MWDGARCEYAHFSARFQPACHRLPCLQQPPTPSNAANAVQDVPRIYQTHLRLANDKLYFTWQDLATIINATDKTSLEIPLTKINKLTGKTRIEDMALRAVQAALTGSSRLPGKDHTPENMQRPKPLPHTQQRPAAVYFAVVPDARPRQPPALLKHIRDQQKLYMCRTIYNASKHLFALDDLLLLLIGADGTGTHGHTDWGVAYNVAYAVRYPGEQVGEPVE
jgi:hypothetical protein